MTMPRETVAVIIPAFNVAGIIRASLESVSFADEVIVVDMFSTDDTESVCRSFPNVRFFQRQDYINGNFNFGLEQTSSDWVIRLDSDEVLDEELQRDIVRVLESGDQGINGYYLSSVQYMFGLPMRYGVGASSVTARMSMFRRGTAYYPRRSDHEGLTATGPFGYLQGRYKHFTNHTTSEVLRKFDYYTTNDVERLEPGNLTAPCVWRIVYRCLRQFVWMYFQQKGYRDGALGFFSAAFRGPIYILLEEAKKWERWRSTTAEKNGTTATATEPTIACQR